MQQRRPRPAHLYDGADHDANHNTGADHNHDANHNTGADHNHDANHDAGADHNNADTGCRSIRFCPFFREEGT